MTRFYLTEVADKNYFYRRDKLQYVFTFSPLNVLSKIFKNKLRAGYSISNDKREKVYTSHPGSKVMLTFAESTLSNG